MEDKAEPIMPPPRLTLQRGPMAKEASEEMKEVGLARGCEEEALHWAE